MYSLCVIRINSLDAPGDDHQPVIAQAGGQRQQRVACLHIDIRRLNGIPAQGIDVCIAADWCRRRFQAIRCLRRR